MAYRIKELREKKKLTQEQLAQKSGVSRMTIIALENNEEHEALVGTLKSLANALEVPVSKLFA
jgi:transcriptional regulator with XRE-family HTH domain